MKIYASYGTYGFLHQIYLNHPEHNLHEFSTSDNSVIIEETEGETILKEPLAYEVLASEGELNDNYFYAVIAIPTSEDHAYQLENKLTSVTADFESYGGFKTYRALRPDQGTTYKVYLGFEKREDYEAFKSSSVFTNTFSKTALSQFFGSSGQYSSYFERYLYPIVE